MAEGDSVAVGAETGEVIDVSGHTVGHVAFHFPGAQAVFTGDSLMALGCGRLFEGAAPVMWESLRKLAALLHVVDGRVGQGNDLAKLVPADGAFAERGWCLTHRPAPPCSIPPFHVLMPNLLQCGRDSDLAAFPASGEPWRRIGRR